MGEAAGIGATKPTSIEGVCPVAAATRRCTVGDGDTTISGADVTAATSAAIATPASAAAASCCTNAAAVVRVPAAVAQQQQQVKSTEEEMRQLLKTLEHQKHIAQNSMSQLNKLCVDWSKSVGV